LVTTKPASKSYIPDRGDIIWLNFVSQSGHEQSGVRPVLVISPQSYNGLTNLALVCPLTSKIKGYPFEVALLKHEKVSGVVLCDQIKSLDWRARRAKFIVKAEAEILEDVVAKLRTLL
jgi:mRNA interferase MazF